MCCVVHKYVFSTRDFLGDFLKAKGKQQLQQQKKNINSIITVSREKVGSESVTNTEGNTQQTTTTMNAINLRQQQQQ